MGDNGIEVFYPELIPHPVLGNPPPMASFPPKTEDIWNGMYWRYRVFQFQRQNGGPGADKDTDEDLADAIAYASAVILASLYATSFVDREVQPSIPGDPDSSMDSTLSGGFDENEGSLTSSVASTSTTDSVTKFDLDLDVFEPNAFFQDLYSSIMSQAQLFRKHLSLPQASDRHDIVRLAKYNAAAVNASLLLYPLDLSSRGKKAQFPMKDDGSGKFQTIRTTRYAAAVAALTLEAEESFPRALTLRELNHAIRTLRGYGLDERPPKVVIPVLRSVSSPENSPL